MLLQNVTCKKSHLTVSQIRVVVSISMNLPVERPLSKGPASMSFRPSVIKRCACDLKAILLWVRSSRLATWWKKSPLDLMRSSPFWCVVGWEGFDAKSQFSRQAFCVFCEYFMHFVQAQSCHFWWRPHFVYSVRNWQNFMLPGGQLLFTNSNLHRHFKAQISQAGSCLWFMPKKLSVFICVPISRSRPTATAPSLSPSFTLFFPNRLSLLSLTQQHIHRPRVFGNQGLEPEMRCASESGDIGFVILGHSFVTRWPGWVPPNFAQSGREKHQAPCEVLGQQIRMSKGELCWQCFLFKSFLNWIISKPWILFHLFLAKIMKCYPSAGLHRRSKWPADPNWSASVCSGSDEWRPCQSRRPKQLATEESPTWKKDERLQSRDAGVKSGLVCLVIRRTSCRISSGLQCPPRIWTKPSHPSRTVLQRPEKCECRMLKTDHRRIHFMKGLQCVHLIQT